MNFFSTILILKPKTTEKQQGKFLLCCTYHFKIDISLDTYVVLNI